MIYDDPGVVLGPDWSCGGVFVYSQSLFQPRAHYLLWVSHGERTLSDRYQQPSCKQTNKQTNKYSGHFLDVAETSSPYPWISMGIGYCVLRHCGEPNEIIAASTIFLDLPLKLTVSTNSYNAPLHFASTIRLFSLPFQLIAKMCRFN